MFQTWEKVLETRMCVRRSWKETRDIMARQRMKWDKCSRFVRSCLQICFFRCADKCYREPHMEHLLGDLDVLMNQDDTPVRMLKCILS